MKNFLIILGFITLAVSCKKDKMCTQLNGHYKLTEYTNPTNGVTSPVPDTGTDININSLAFLADNLIIDKDQNIVGYRGAKGSVTKYTDKVDCNSILEVQVSYFIAGGGGKKYKYTKF